MRRGFLAGRVWVVGRVIRVRGLSKGRWWSKLLLVGFGDGVRCSRSLLHGLPPPTHMYSSLSVDRIELGLILIVEDGEDGVGLVQSDGVVAAGGVVASANGEGWALPGEGGVPSPCLDKLASILCTCGVLSCLVGR